MSGVRICEGNDYGGLRIRFAAERRSASLERLQNGAARPERPANSSERNLLLNKPYALAAEGGIPAGELELFLEGSSGKMLELTLPVTRTPTVKRGGQVLEPAASLAALRASTETAYYLGADTLHVKPRGI